MFSNVSADCGSGAKIAALDKGAEESSGLLR